MIFYAELSFRNERNRGGSLHSHYIAALGQQFHRLTILPPPDQILDPNLESHLKFVLNNSQWLMSLRLVSWQVKTTRHFPNFTQSEDSVCFLSAKGSWSNNNMCLSPFYVITTTTLSYHLALKLFVIDNFNNIRHIIKSLLRLYHWDITNHFQCNFT